MASVGNIWVRLGVKDETSKQIDKVFGKLRSSMLTFGAAFAGMNFLKGAIDNSNDFVEQQNAVGILLGENEKKLESFGKTAAKTYGLGQADVLKYANQLDGVLKLTEKSKSEITDMIIDIQKHVSDFGSFKEVTNIDQFMSSVIGGLAGNVPKSLKTFGILLDQASLQAGIAKGEFTDLGIATDASFQSLDRASQTMIRYRTILDQTAEANNDFARSSSSSWENTKKILSKSLQDLQIQLGKKMLPTLINLFTWLNDHLAGTIKMLGILGGMFVGFKIGSFVGQMLKVIALLIAAGTARVFSETGLAAIAAVPAALGAITGAVGGILAMQGMSLSGDTTKTQSPTAGNTTLQLNVNSVTGTAALNGQPFNSQGNLNGVNT